MRVNGMIYVMRLTSFQFAIRFVEAIPTASW
jgi:hypothetical protein